MSADLEFSERLRRATPFPRMTHSQRPHLSNGERTVLGKRDGELICKNFTQVPWPVLTKGSERHEVPTPAEHRVCAESNSTRSLDARSNAAIEQQTDDHRDWTRRSRPRLMRPLRGPPTTRVRTVRPDPSDRPPRSRRPARHLRWLLPSTSGPLLGLRTLPAVQFRRHRHPDLHQLRTTPHRRLRVLRPGQAPHRELG